MKRLVLMALVAAGCVDATKCHMPSAWQPCAGGVAEPGASGTPPTIAMLSLPTCAYVATPQVSGTLHVTDPDSDAQIVKITISQGPRLGETEVALPDAGRSGTDWTGALSVAIPMPMALQQQSSYDVSIKVTDRAGGQSAPVCDSITLFP
jgi:hypothetical protein